MDKVVKKSARRWCWKLRNPRGSVDARRYEILYDQRAGEYDAAGIGAIRTRTIRAGDSLEVECFPVVRGYQEGAERERGRRKTSAAQEKINQEHARKRMLRLAEANFGPGDFAVHPTFDYGGLDRDRMSYAEAMAAWERYGWPRDDKDARRLLYNFIERIRSAVKRAGGDPAEVKYLSVFETTHEPRDVDFFALPACYHYHMALHAPGLSREKVEALWPEGFCNCDRLDFRQNGLEPLITYMAKQRRSTRRWSHSKNLVEPEVRESDRKVSRRRAAEVAADCMRAGRGIFEALYPGYRCMDVQVRYSDFVAGAYIYARLRRDTGPSGLMARAERAVRRQ